MHGHRVSCGFLLGDVSGSLLRPGGVLSFGVALFSAFVESAHWPKYMVKYGHYSLVTGPAGPRSNHSRQFQNF